jgi:hypothetical protein
MTKQAKRAAILIGLVILASVAFLALRDSPFFKGLASGSSASKTNALQGASSIAAAPPRPANNHDRTLIQSVVREIQSSQDIQATYDKYRSHPDPTGEIAFRLSRAMDDCIHFAHKSVDQLSKEMNAVGTAATQSVPRRRAIERQIQRCKGFRAENVTITVISLRDQSSSLGYPGAVASMLPIRLIREHAEGLDADAIQLLSAKDIDGDVIKGVFNYLSQRNGEAWLSQFGDPAVATAAWALLQCNYGTSCDESNPIVSVSCIYYAACDRLDVASALPSVYPSLTQERLQEAVRLVPILASQIQSRDWVRLGFSKQQGTNPH